MSKSTKLSIVFLLMSTLSAWSQPQSSTPAAPVAISPQLYSELWNYLITTECRNPVALLNALSVERANAEAASKQKEQRPVPGEPK